MYWFPHAGIAQQMNTTKLRILSKIIKMTVVTKGLALIPSYNIKQFTNLSMNVQNRSSGGVLK